MVEDGPMSNVEACIWFTRGVIDRILDYCEIDDERQRLLAYRGMAVRCNSPVGRWHFTIIPHAVMRMRKRGMQYEYAIYGRQVIRGLFGWEPIGQERWAFADQIMDAQRIEEGD